MSDKDGSSSDSNIQTYLRIRPSKTPSGYFKVDDLNDKALHFYLPENYKPASDYVNNTKMHYNFQFHGLIPMTATQDDVFKKVGIEAVRNALEGYNSTIFAYGQTGSGKTFTLTGGQEKYSDRGIIPRALSMVFQEMKKGDMQYKYYISYMEIYNEQGYDLLSKSSDKVESRGEGIEALPKVSMLEDEHGNFHIKNLSMHPADSEEEALDLLFIGDTNRAVAETPMNLESSRSHCIFTISIEGRVPGTEKVRRSKLHLVDLAGSERVAKTNSSGTILQQAKYINSSLFYLEMVIVALYERATKGRSHIPYRNSMMTSALRDSLGGNCKTIMIATINPEPAHTDESLSTCRFAQRVSMIKNTATINEDVDPSVLIGKLKNEMLNMREEIVFLKGEAGEGEALTPQELEELKESCRIYFNDNSSESILDIGKLTLTKIKSTFSIMKELYKGAIAGSDSIPPRPPGVILTPRQGEAGESDSRFIKEIQDLKSSLLQREHEIAILVNMVKKGVAINPNSQNSSINPRNGAPIDKNNLRGGNLNESQTVNESDAKTDNRQVQKASMKSVQDQQREREMAREELIIKRHLFGVPPPSTKAIFDDAAASFAWFKERCSLTAAIEENSKLLNDSISEAKLMGERANQSRNSITHLKASIEAMRKERALQGLSRSEVKDDESKPDDQESLEEQAHRKAIEQEKIVYKESFERLRILKPEIENIRKLIENGRIKLQAQFNEWYDNLHSRKLYDEQSTDKPTASPRASANSSQSAYTSIETISTGPLRNGNPTYSDTSSISSQSTKYKQSDVAPGKSDSVNDDITAFYQAKEELLKRRAGGR